jgi:hypothetical protein
MLNRKSGNPVDVAALQQEVGNLTVQLQAAHLQLQFWKEQSRQMENQMRMWQGMYSEALNTMRKLGEAPPDFEHHAALVKEAMEAPGQGVEALIMAVSLAAADTKGRIAKLMPDLAPLMKRLKKAPALPRTQGVRDVTAERSALRDD